METISGTFVLADTGMTAPLERSVGAGEAVFFSRGNDLSPGPNEDSCGAFAAEGGSVVLALADGAGGPPAGHEASSTAVRELLASVEEAVTEEQALREAILAGFERANAAILERGIGSVTTLSAALIEGATIRFFHVGDSEILLTGQRGKIRWKTISHSPVAYAVEAGFLEETEAMHHDERHVVSSFVGTRNMRIEIGPAMDMRPRDTLVIASDGLFDNLHVEEIVECVRKGPQCKAAKRLIEDCTQRMHEGRKGEPSKPDDLTFILFRRAALPRHRSAS